MSVSEGSLLLESEIFTALARGASVATLRMTSESLQKKNWRDVPPVIVLFYARGCFFRRLFKDAFDRLRHTADWIL